MNGYLNVEGTVAPVESSGEAVRVDVKFTAFCLKIGVLPQLKIPLGWSNPTVGPLMFQASCEGAGLLLTFDGHFPEVSPSPHRSCDVRCSTSLLTAVWCNGSYGHLRCNSPRLSGACAICVKLLRSLQGWVDTTYLDEDTRIGRGDKGSVFVTARKGTRADIDSKA